MYFLNIQPSSKKPTLALKLIVVTNSKGETVNDVKSSWDISSNILYQGFENSPGGIKVNIEL
jgi:hypothetical protein